MTILTHHDTSYNLVLLQILWENGFAYNSGSHALTPVDVEPEVERSWTMLRSGNLHSG